MATLYWPSTLALMLSIILCASMPRSKAPFDKFREDWRMDLARLRAIPQGK